MTGTRIQLVLAFTAAVVSVGGALFLAAILLGHMRVLQPLPEDYSLFVLTGKIEHVDVSTSSLVVGVKSQFPPLSDVALDDGGVLRYRVRVASSALLVRTIFEAREGVIERLSAQNARTLSDDLRELSPGMLTRIIGRSPEGGAQGYTAQLITVNEFIEAAR